MTEITDNLIKDPVGKIEKIKNNQRLSLIAAVPPICPFMSTPSQEASCTPRCKMYRKERRGYECYLMELQSISWNTRAPRGARERREY